MRVACLRFLSRQSGFADHALSHRLHGLYYSDKNLRQLELESKVAKPGINNGVWKWEQEFCIPYRVLISQTRLQILPGIHDDRLGDMISHHPSFWKYRFTGRKCLKFVLQKYFDDTPHKNKQLLDPTNCIWSNVLLITKQGLQNRMCLILFPTSEFPIKV